MKLSNRAVLSLDSRLTTPMLAILVIISNFINILQSEHCSYSGNEVPNKLSNFTAYAITESGFKIFLKNHTEQHHTLITFTEHLTWYLTPLLWFARKMSRTLSAALTGTVLFSTTILFVSAIEAIIRAADSRKRRSAALPCWKNPPENSAKTRLDQA